MKIIKLFLLLFTFCAGYSQNVIDVDKNSNLTSQSFYVASGFPVSSAKYVRLTSGSPYFSETWMKGTAFITDSTVARNVRMRLDLLEGSLLYLNDKDEELISTLSVFQVSMTDTLTDNKYVFINSSLIPGSASNKTWYQVLAGGKFTLLKEYHKEMLETKAYGSSVTEQTIHTDERYFIGSNNIITRVKKLKDIADLAGNKKQQLLDYIDKNKLNGKKESDFFSVVEYYHTLQ